MSEEPARRPPVPSLNRVVPRTFAGTSPFREPRAAHDEQAQRMLLVLDALEVRGLGARDELARHVSPSCTPCATHRRSGRHRYRASSRSGCVKSPRSRRRRRSWRAAVGLEAWSQVPCGEPSRSLFPWGAGSCDSRRAWRVGTSAQRGRLRDGVHRRRVARDVRPRLRSPRSATARARSACRRVALFTDRAAARAAVVRRGRALARRGRRRRRGVRRGRDRADRRVVPRRGAVRARRALRRLRLARRRLGHRHVQGGEPATRRIPRRCAPT